MAYENIKQKVAEFLKAHGCKVDRWGHYTKTRKNDKKYRYKFNKNTLRYEVKLPHGWMRLYSGYWKNIRFNEEGKISGMSRS